MSLPKKIYGLIGYPVKHSLSPLMHNAAFEHLGINAEYKLFEVTPDDLENFLISRKDVAGFNITIPHKVEAKEILERYFPSQESVKNMPEIAALITGAVNTVSREPEIKFYNTDSVGFSVSLEKDLGFEKEDKTILLIGCGGAGRAVVGSLTASEASVKKIYIYEVNSEAAGVVDEHFSKNNYTSGKYEFITYQQIPEVIKQCQLLVNATPVGMKEGDASPVEKDLLHKDLSVYDVVYNRITDLIKDARSLGLAAITGEGMLLYQGAAAFEIWTGTKAPIDIMREVLNKELRK
ncbi:MAG: shikimate dehydrogenase [Candidatus Saelkia tenebricola]|nr:shikimate dehydrogenase [Candidatus Saelkia tenebricola]